MTITLGEDGSILGIAGNTCPRGKTYAQSECTHPVRTVTSTVMCEGGAIISVKTASPVPKEKMFDVIAAINSHLAPSSVRIGDVIIENVADTGISIVATSNP